MAQAQRKFEAGELDEDDLKDEKEKLQDEYENRNYKQWNRGATFDYVRYGMIEDKHDGFLFSKVLHIHVESLFGKYTRVLTFENLWQARKRHASRRRTSRRECQYLLAAAAGSAQGREWMARCVY